MIDYVKAEKTPEGDLRLVLYPEARAELLELRARVKSGEISTGDAEADVLEYLIGNGFSNVAPEACGALTSAPMISDELEWSDEDGPVPVHGSRVYAYMDYQVTSFVDDLADKGVALWTGDVCVAKDA